MKCSLTKQFLAAVLVLLIPAACWPQWNAYFSDPTGTADDDIDQQLVNLIDSAQSTIDVTIYSFTNSGVVDALVDAANSGLTVRFTYDADLGGNANISALMDAGGSGKIEDDQVSYAHHHKFVVIDRADAGSSVRDTVWTGSFNFSGAGANSQFNNAIRVNNNSRITDAFYNEFNEMFGDGTSGNFHSAKTGPAGPYSFDVSGGTSYNDMIYFSPYDSYRIEDQIVSAINSADEQVKFNIYTFTSAAIQSALMDAVDRGVEVTGIFDTSQVANSAVYDALVAHTNLANLYDSEYIFEGGAGDWAYMHNKFLIIDPGSTSDPTIVTGSANWTTAANVNNDENVLIIHDSSVANTYHSFFDSHWSSYQSFQAGNGVPEPSSFLMLILGGSASILAWAKRRRH